MQASFVLKSLTICASHLERLVIYFKAFPDDAVSLDHPFTEFVVQFAKKMERLVALCIVFFNRRHSGGHSDCCSCCSCYYDDDEPTDALMEQINRRMAEEVLPTRPALWFHLGSDIPNATDPDVPLIHYREMIHIDQWNPPNDF